MRSLTQPAPVAHTIAPAHRKRPWLLTALGFAALALPGAVMIVPFVWMIATSLKAPGTALTIPPELIPRAPTLESYRRVAATVPLLQMFKNSVVVTAASVTGQLVTSALAAYAFARMRWRGRDVLFLLYRRRSRSNATDQPRQ